MFKLNKIKLRIRSKRLPLGVKEVKVKDIIISDRFKADLPRAEKVYEKYSNYRKTGRFEDKILLDENYLLLDGYITYMIARMVGVKKVFVKVTKNKIKNKGETI